ncbi:MAG: chorismate mutase [Acidobacteriaceae bacterium]
MNIQDWRKKIDAIDLQIVELLNQRAEAARAIGVLKEATELPVYEPNRERIIFDSVRSHNRGPLPDSELVFIYQRVVAVMRALQRSQLASQQPEGFRPEQM